MHWSDKVSTTKLWWPRRVYQNCKFHDPRGWSSGHGHISHYSEYVFSSTLSIYSTLIAIVLMDYDTALLYHCWYLFILRWDCLYANISHSDKIHVIRSVYLYPHCGILGLSPFGERILLGPLNIHGIIKFRVKTGFDSVIKMPKVMETKPENSAESSLM